MDRTPDAPHPLTGAMAELSSTTGMLLKGKTYRPVASRVEVFRKHFPAHTLAPEIIENSDTVIVKAVIADPDGRVIAVDFAEEKRSAKGVNSTSALENCVTSAIGRVLANFGLLGGEYASANELEQALSQQKAKEAKTQLSDHLSAIDSAASLDQLEEAFTDAVDWLKIKPSQRAQKRIVTAKDKKKNALEAADGEQQAAD